MLNEEMEPWAQHPTNVNWVSQDNVLQFPCWKNGGDNIDGVCLMAGMCVWIIHRVNKPLPSCFPEPSAGCPYT
jgi:hypothetical protein